MQTMSLDMRFEKEIKTNLDDFETRRKEYLEIVNDPAKLEEFKKKESKAAKLDENIFFQDENQLIRPTTAYR